MFFDKIGDLPKHATSFGRRHARPWTFVKGAARCRYRAVHVLGFGLWNVRDDFAGCGIVNRKCFRGRRRDETAVNEHPVLAAHKVGGTAAETWIKRQSGHGKNLLCCRAWLLWGR